MQHHATKQPGKVLVLLSGGVDSATCIAFYQDLQFEVSCLFVDFGHPAASAESRASRRIAKHYGLELHKVKLSGIPPKDEGFVPGRNAFLFALALAKVPTAPGLIAFGIHAGTRYPDCSAPFVEACQTMADIYADGALQVAAPFLEWTKGDVVNFARQAGVPLETTYSCEAGTAEPCGHCLSCIDRTRNI